MRPPNPTVTVVTVSYGDEPWLERSVQACLDSVGEVVEVVLVDNGCTDGAVDRLESVDGVRVVRPGTNTGFAGGCNLGAAEAFGEIIAFVNPDALVEIDALHRLAARSRELPGIASACVVLADAPDRVNSAGNEYHFLGLSWSGGFNEPTSDHLVARPTIAASGACMTIPAALFNTLGGFEEQLFAYYEDADLTIRAWQAGSEAWYVPEAIARHRYEFGKNELKYYLLDRNRWITLLTLFEARTLLLIAPLLVVQDIALWGVAGLQGWAGPKARSSIWVLTHLKWLRQRRRAVSDARRVGDRQLAPLFTSVLNPANVAMPRWVAAFSSVLRRYWGWSQSLMAGPRRP